MKKFLILLLLLATPVLAAPVADTFSDPAMEARAHALQRSLRCLVCQGESIDDSGSDFSRDMRHLVRQQMADGQTDRQIQDYLRARYGNFILMQPPLEADTYFLWAAPFLVLIGAGAVAMLVIGRARKAAVELPPDPL